MPPRRTSTRSNPVRSANEVERRRWVYVFGDGAADGDRTMGALLGGKGANLAEMSRLGLPVPPGFTLSTEVCRHFYAHERSYPRGLEAQVERALAGVERSLGKRFGSSENPLLVSVRSGAKVSMPGMMDTVLNLGLNDRTVEGLARAAQDARFAWDAYRRFVQMYADVVLGLKGARGDEVSPFTRALDALKRERSVAQDTELSADDLRALVLRFRRIVADHGFAFPDEPREQLWGAIGAVFGSWMTDRAVAYRELHHIPSDGGTAVSVCAMVYGNMGPDSGTGVAFTRDPATGAKRFYGEFLMNAQGEDVVAGLRTPLEIGCLERTDPRSWKELARIQRLLERHYRDMQDIEFTIERGRLFMLQCRTGKRTGMAAVRIAVDMARERLISRDEALLRVPPAALEHLLKPVFEARAVQRARDGGGLLTRGLNAGPGAACGRIVFRAEDAERWAARGEPVVLVRLETSPEDIRGMQAARGVLTARGGMTSHAALVARQMGKVCVAGAGELEIEHAARELRVAGRVLREGDWVSLDGTTGEVFEGRIDTQPSEVMLALFEGDASARRGPTWRAFEQLMRWADRARVLGVRANADQPDQCRVAIAFGAEGIGLCRTEHMFFEGDKIDCVREMILADTREERERALAKLLPLQRADFEGIFEEMAPHPCTIRTLDPPLHEFLPHDPAAIAALAAKLGVEPERLAHKVAALHEENPMLGHRGCRLGISHPEITAMQSRALFEAACAVRRRRRKVVRPEIMIPLVATRRELELQARVVRETAEQVFSEQGLRIPYLVGTMIELPRACVAAAQIAEHAEFFSFGTNDLTQTTYGISRDDGARFIPLYVGAEVFAADPFATLDTEGVGALMRIAVDQGRGARADLKLGICGEHGGDPRSIAFCHELGLDYVSCSPHRLPIARLAAAQAALLSKSAPPK